MQLQLKNAIRLMLFVILFTGLRGGRYFLENKLQEVGILFCIILFFYTSFNAAVICNNKEIRWNFWFFGPLIFVVYIIVVPAILFGYYNNVSPIPSMLAAREFIFILLMPILYFLYRSGYKQEYFEGLFVFTIGLLVVMYLILANVIPLQQWYFSGDRYKATMVANDGWRGFRLHAPATALQIGFFLFYFKTFHNKGQRVFWFILLVISTAALIKYNSRSFLAIIPLSILFFYMFAYNRKNFPILLFIFPFLFSTLAYMGYHFFQELAIQYKQGDDTRLPMYHLALNVLSNKPLLGMGMSSNFSRTDGELFNTWFFPVDIGLVGIAYRYGMFGALLYVSSIFYLFFVSLRTHFHYSNALQKTNIVILVMICRSIADLFRYILSVDYANGHGLVIASVIVVFNRMQFDKLKLAQSS